MPFVKEGDLIQLPGPGPAVGLVLSVRTSSEPDMRSQLVIDGNPVDCNAHYVAEVWVEERAVWYKFDVGFYWEGGGCQVHTTTARRLNTHEGWTRVGIFR